ncbi:MAG: FtsK/SpoIIIE domain-containing protein [Acidimicrobiales bacterium]
MLPIGLHLGSIENRLDELAAALNARNLRARPWRGGSRFVELFVIMGDPFSAPVASPLVNRTETSLWEPVSMGVGEDGSAVTVTLPEHNLLIGGEPGSGKSVALSSIVAAAALDPCAHLTLLDGKEVELSVWRDVAECFVGSSLTDALATLEGLRETMEVRYQHLADSRRRKITEGDDDGLHVLVIDELALYLRGGERVVRERFAEVLRDLVARGRAAGIVVVAATQKPSHEIVPTWIRDLFSYRLAMRCTNPDASDTILGQGWASQGYNAATIDSAKRGVGLLLAEGGLPRLVRVPYLDDNQIDQIAQRACRLRAS